MYFNLTELLGTEGKVTGAKVVTNAALRVATVANKFKVMTIVLHPDRNSTTLDLRLDYSTGVNTSFTVWWYSVIEKKKNIKSFILFIF